LTILNNGGIVDISLKKLKPLIYYEVEECVSIPDTIGMLSSTANPNPLHGSQLHFNKGGGGDVEQVTIS
jgi:hypothetical protein